MGPFFGEEGQKAIAEEAGGGILGGGVEVEARGGGGGGGGDGGCGCGGGGGGEWDC